LLTVVPRPQDGPGAYRVLAMKCEV
jgi:hypothetical protein